MVNEITFSFRVLNSNTREIGIFPLKLPYPVTEPYSTSKRIKLSEPETVRSSQTKLLTEQNNKTKIWKDPQVDVALG